MNWSTCICIIPPAWFFFHHRVIDKKLNTHYHFPLTAPLIRTKIRGIKPRRSVLENPMLRSIRSTVPWFPWDVSTVRTTVWPRSRTWYRKDSQYPWWWITSRTVNMVVYYVSNRDYNNWVEGATHERGMSSPFSSVNIDMVIRVD